MKKKILLFLILLCSFCNVYAEDVFNLECHFEKGLITCDIYLNDIVNDYRNIEWSQDNENLFYNSYEFNYGLLSTIYEERSVTLEPVNEPITGKVGTIKYNLYSFDENSTVRLTFKLFDNNDNLIAEEEKSSTVFSAEYHDYRKLIESTRLANLSVVNYPFKFVEDKIEYTAYIPYDIDEIYINADPLNDQTSVSGAGLVKLNKDTKKVLITTSCAGLPDTNYIINIHRTYNKYIIIGGYGILGLIIIILLFVIFSYKRAIKKKNNSLATNNIQTTVITKQVNIEPNNQVTLNEAMNKNGTIPVNQTNPNLVSEPVEQKTMVINLDQINK